MNPVTHAAAEQTDMGWLLAMVTVLFFASFLYWIFYAWRPANRAFFDQASRIPLTDDPSPRGES